MISDIRCHVLFKGIIHIGIVFHVGFLFNNVMYFPPLFYALYLFQVTHERILLHFRSWLILFNCTRFIFPLCVSLCVFVYNSIAFSWKVLFTLRVFLMKIIANGVYSVLHECMHVYVCLCHLEISIPIALCKQWHSKIDSSFFRACN